MFVNKRLSKESRGFTLAELIVSVSIIVTFSLIFLVKYRTFTSSVHLSSLAYDVGLALREAQVYGISVREQSLGDFSYAYGVRFHMSNPTQFLSFVDINGNGRYQSSADDPGEVLEIYNITKGNQVSDICAYVPSGVNQGLNCGLDAAHVTFLRPDPNADFITSPNFPQASEVEIYLESPRTNEQKVVSVTRTGQISIE